MRFAELSVAKYCVSQGLSIALSSANNSARMTHTLSLSNMQNAHKRCEERRVPWRELERRQPNGWSLGGWWWPGLGLGPLPAEREGRFAAELER